MHIMRKIVKVKDQIAQAKADLAAEDTRMAAEQAALDAQAYRLMLDQSASNDVMRRRYQSRLSPNLPKDFKGPRKVANYTADLSPESWVESYEMAMEMLDVDDAACAKYFTMMLEGTACTWLKNLSANSIGS